MGFYDWPSFRMERVERRVSPGALERKTKLEPDADIARRASWASYQRKPDKMRVIGEFNILVKEGSLKQQDALSLVAKFSRDKEARLAALGVLRELKKKEVLLDIVNDRGAKDVKMEILHNDCGRHDLFDITHEAKYEDIQKKAKGLLDRM